MTTKTPLTSIAFAALPAIGTELDGGTFAGITTRKDGTHIAVILLPEHGEQLTWKKALNWAKKLGAELPSRPVTSMLFANTKPSLSQAGTGPARNTTLRTPGIAASATAASTATTRATRARLLPSA